MVEFSDYAGREQSYVKHWFLERYFGSLVHKTASTFTHIVYVDGYAGPWRSADERFEDTSFGIALNALRSAKGAWSWRHNVRMSAYLCESTASAFGNLATVPALYPDLEVNTFHGKFLDALPGILRDIPRGAFAFFLIDPKGWRIPLASLEPMLARRHSEVVFNFMFDFINRAASMREAPTATGLDELMPHGNWRARLGAASSPEERKAVLVDAFTENLRHFGGYKYVAETTVLQRVRDRALYCLFYATGHDAGIKAFRNAQVEALKVQSATRAATKITHSEESTSQGEIFESFLMMGPDDLTEFLRSERDAAASTLLSLVPPAPDSIAYGELWPQVLARHVVKEADVNKIAIALRRQGMLIFLDWEERRRRPAPHYRVQRPTTTLATA